MEIEKVCKLFVFGVGMGFLVVSMLFLVSHVRLF